MFLKPLLFLSLLVSGLIVPLAEAKLGGLGGIVGSILGMIRIQGVVYCTPNGNAGVNRTSTPVFPNAVVELECGAGNVVANTTTDPNGMFSFGLDPLKVRLSSLLEHCNVVVNTPLSTCNATLPSTGILSSPLQLIGNTVSGVLKTTNLIPVGFILLK